MKFSTSFEHFYLLCKSFRHYVQVLIMTFTELFFCENGQTFFAKIYRQSSVKKPTSRILQVKVASIFYPFYLSYPRQPWLTLNWAKVQSSNKEKLELYTKYKGLLVANKKRGRKSENNLPHLDLNLGPLKLKASVLPMSYIDPWQNYLNHM